jgi:molecular chaperone GrpE (heat shock protein)
MTRERIEELEKQIAELEGRWPAHSVPPTMLQQLEELEAELEEELKRAGAEQEDAKSGGGCDAHRAGTA